MHQENLESNVLEFPPRGPVVKADTDDGYTRLANTYLEALAQCEISGLQIRILLSVIRRTYGYQRKTDWVTSSLIASDLNYTSDDSNIRKLIKDLKDRNLIISDGRNIGPNPIVSDWEIGKRVKNNPEKVKNYPGEKLPGSGLKTTRKRVKNNPATGEKQPTQKKVLKESKKESIKKKKVEFIQPDWLNMDLFEQYVEMRKSNRKPMTDHAKNLAVKKLDDLINQGFDQDEIINTAILKCWQSFYAPKQQNQKPSKPNNNAAAVQAWLESEGEA